MIVFELTMPGVGSWNRKWSGEDMRWIEVRNERGVPKDIVGKDFYYNWSDGWTACVSTSKVSAREAEKLRKLSSGFCGYDWMIDSIIRLGEIKPMCEK